MGYLLYPAANATQVGFGERGKIGVMSILHERMDIPARLVEELVEPAGDLTGEDQN